jgi:hypothetical protein
MTDFILMIRMETNEDGIKNANQFTPNYKFGVEEGFEFEFLGFGFR